MFKAAIPDESLLNGVVLFCDEFANRQGHTFFFRSGASAVELYVESADH
jgi:hypothetical protein